MQRSAFYSTCMRRTAYFSTTIWFICDVICHEFFKISNHSRYQFYSFNWNTSRRPTTEPNKSYVSFFTSPTSCAFIFPSQVQFHLFLITSDQISVPRIQQELQPYSPIQLRKYECRISMVAGDLWVQLVSTRIFSAWHRRIGNKIIFITFGCGMQSN